ncbi:MAG: hypothetical protein ABR512_00200 [Desulfopila sp.]
MILAITATDFEMAPFLRDAPGACRSLVTGVGVLESGLRLSRYLEQHRREFAMALHFGVAGAYVDRVDEEAAGLLDICIADKEILGDLGICFPHRIDELPEDLGLQKIFDLDEQVVQDHIGLYVNEYSLELGEEGRQAVATFLRCGREAGILPPSNARIML